ncbi:hypothetical protein ACQR2L_08775 [Clostridium butyricum]|uniref:hypothetical protein n=1 Tax=Clostridium butyricum TaxID=1492 RepID=UPI003D1317E2
MEVFLVITIFVLGILYMKRLINLKLKKEKGTIFNVLGYIFIGFLFVSIILCIMFLERRYSIMTVILYSIMYIAYIILGKRNKY